MSERDVGMIAFPPTTLDIDELKLDVVAGTTLKAGEGPRLGGTASDTFVENPHRRHSSVVVRGSWRLVVHVDLDRCPDAIQGDVFKVDVTDRGVALSSPLDPRPGACVVQSNIAVRYVADRIIPAPPSTTVS